jgi:hypothetical protein
MVTLLTVKHFTVLWWLFVSWTHFYKHIFYLLHNACVNSQASRDSHLLVSKLLPLKKYGDVFRSLSKVPHVCEKSCKLFLAFVVIFIQRIQWSLAL